MSIQNLIIEELIEAVRAYLKEEDRTAAWFARQCGVSRTQIVQMLDGRRTNLQADTVAKIEKVLERRPEVNTETMNRLLKIIETQQKTIDDLTKKITELQAQIIEPPCRQTYKEKTRIKK